MSYLAAKSYRLERYATRATIALRSKAKEGGEDSWALEVRLGEYIMAAMNWVHGTRIQILYGDGSDFGKLKLKPLDKGVRLKGRSNHGGPPCKSGTASTCYVWRKEIKDQNGGRWKLKFIRQMATSVPHHVLPDGTLELTMPVTWFEQVKAAPKWHTAA